MSNSNPITDTGSTPKATSLNSTDSTLSAPSAPTSSTSATSAASGASAATTTGATSSAPAPAKPLEPQPDKRVLKFVGKNFKKSYQMFLSFGEAPTEPFIYYEIPIPHINFFFNSSNEDNIFEFEYVDRLAVGAGVRMSGYPSGGPITSQPIKKGQKAALTMQSHKMKITVEDDPENPLAIEFKNNTSNSYPQTLSLGFINSKETFVTIFSNPHTTALSYANFVPHLRAYYTVPTEDLTHVRANQMWDADLFDLKETTVINLEDKGGSVVAVVSRE